MYSKEKGITLTALVVTIVLLLLLSAISINAAIGDDGLVNRSFNAKIDKEKQEAATAVVEAISRLKYYSNVSADKGVTINSLLRTLNLEKYTNGRIHGIKSDGKNVIVYFSNDRGSYTVTVDENGGTRTELGLVVKKDEENNVEMAQGERVTLTSDEEITYWVVAGGDIGSVEINSTTGEVTKKGEGTVVIYGYKSKEDAETGNYIEVTIKDKKEEINPIAQTGDNSGSGNDIIYNEEEEEQTEAVNDIAGSPGPEYVGFLKIGEYSYIWLKNLNNINTMALFVDDNANGIVEVYDKYKNGITFEEASFYYNYSWNCSDIEEIIIEEKVKEVPDNIFNNFTNTQQLSLPKSLIKLGKIVDEINTDNQATKGLINLEQLNYACERSELEMNKDDRSWGVTVYTNSDEYSNISGCAFGEGYYDFKYTKLKSIVFKDSVKNIPSYIFSHCSYLEEIYIGKNVEVIGNSAFFNCVNLTDIHFETSLSVNNIKTVRGSAFECTGIDSIINSNQLTEIDESVYWGCYNIRRLNIPSNIKSIKRAAFGYCTGIKSITLNNGITEIGDVCFTGCNNLGAISFNSVNSLKKIGFGCFENCYELKSIELPDSIQEIGKRAFYNNRRLSLIKFPKNLNYVADFICIQCDRLYNIIWPEVDFEIGNNSFMNCKSIPSLNISTVTKIGVGAFSYCIGIRDLSLGYKCKEINESAFYSCSNLRSINFDTQLNGQYKSYPRKYDLNTKQFVTSGEQYALSDGVEYIGIDAFGLCVKLNEVTLPDSIKHLDRGCFSGCIGLKKIVFNCNDCTYDHGWVDGLFYPINYIKSDNRVEYGSVFEEIVIGEAVDYIPDGIVSYNNKITNIEIPWTVFDISDNAFSYTPLVETINFTANKKDFIYYAIKDRLPLGGMDGGKGHLVINGTDGEWFNQYGY